MSIKVFLSHSDKDKNIASELKSKLSKHGMSVFLAHEDIEGGADWVSKLYEEIKNSKLFIMLLSKNYHPSKYTDQEAGIALNYKKTILPICIDETRPYGFVSSKQAIVCSLPFEDYIIQKIIEISKTIQTSTSSELDKLLFDLENSGSYAESATIASKLLKYHIFSESQLRRLAFSVLSNPQVSYSYVADEIINKIIGDNLDKVNPILRDELEKFHDPSHPFQSDPIPQMTIAEVESYIEKEIINPNVEASCITGATTLSHNFDGRYWHVNSFSFEQHSGDSSDDHYTTYSSKWDITFDPLTKQFIKLQEFPQETQFVPKSNKKKFGLF